ncbi:GGDEF domain-containing protein [Sedimenticola sp.]|uniref:GGDEF domain-containing protein n=1 Tax=Sedimenticola sp. TaxID=1940285 RepID=UPI003D1119A2
MVELDIRTLSLLAMLVSILMAGAMVVIWRLNPNERSARYWAFGNLSIAAGFLFIGLRGVVPTFVTVPLANTLIIFGYGLLAVGVSTFLERTVRWWWVAASTTLVFISFLYFTYQAPAIGPRIVIISLSVSLLSLLAANQLFRDQVTHMQGVQRLTGGVFVLHALYLTLRGIITLLDAPLRDLFSGNLVQSLAFLDVILVSICLTYGFSAMINRRLQFHLNHLAHYDVLTQVYNRRAFEQAVIRELARCQRRKDPVSILLLDIDHFKQVNDRYGHAAGDEVLRQSTRILGSVLRQEDILGRIGGEEFALLLPATSRQKASEVAERVRLAVAGNVVDTQAGPIQITTSIGTVTSQDVTCGWECLFNLADQALYRAKAQGRNRIAAEQTPPDFPSENRLTETAASPPSSPAEKVVS